MADERPHDWQAQDELEGQLAALRYVGYTDPIKALKEYMQENAAYLTGQPMEKTPYGSAERIAYRLKVQGQIMAMVERGELNHMLERTALEIPTIKEGTDVRD